MTLLPVVLQDGFSPTVSVKDKLTAGQVIAKKQASGQEEIIHLAKDLSVDPKKIVKYLSKNLGDGVNKGDVLAVKKSALGLGKKSVISEISGTVVKIDEVAGDLVIRISGQQGEGESVLSPVDGLVEACNTQKIIIKTDKDAILAQKIAGESARGEIFLIDKIIDFADVKVEVAKKILLARSFEKGAIFKVFGMGAIGVISQSVRDADLEEVSEKNIKSPVFIVGEDDYKKLSKMSGKKVYLDSEAKTIITL